MQQSADQKARLLYHSSDCSELARQVRLMQPRRRKVAETPGTDFFDREATRAAIEAVEPPPQHGPAMHGRHRLVGGSLQQASSRAAQSAAAALSSARSPGGKAVIVLIAGASILGVAAFLVSSRPAASAVLSGAGKPTPHMPAAPAVPSPSPHAAQTPSVTPAATPSSAATTPAPTPAQTSAPPPQTSPPEVVNTFQDGTDGWMREWGPITLTPTTDPAIDGASLLLVTGANSNAGIGTGSDFSTDLTAGQTVTYHVWSSGQPGTVQPLVANLSNDITFATSPVSLPSTPGWFTLTWTVPATSSLEGIGLQIVNPSHGSSLTIAIGDLSWPMN